MTPDATGDGLGEGSAILQGEDDAEQHTAGWCAQALLPLPPARPPVCAPALLAMTFCPNYITTVLKVILFLLYSSSALPCIDSCSQFCVISKFRQQTPSSRAQVINQTLNRPHYRTWVALLPDSCSHITKLLIPHCEWCDGPPTTPAPWHSPMAQPLPVPKQNLRSPH